jgi:hypothetical protein
MRPENSSFFPLPPRTSYLVFPFPLYVGEWKKHLSVLFLSSERAGAGNP